MLPESKTVCRYRQQSVMPPHQLPQHPRGPAIWQVQDAVELLEAVELLLNEPLQHRSQGSAAVHAAARIANGMLTVAWEVLVIMVLEPALAGVPPKAARAAVLDRGTAPGQAGDGGEGDGDEAYGEGEGDGNGRHSTDNSSTSQGTSSGQAGPGEDDGGDGGTLDDRPTNRDA